MRGPQVLDGLRLDKRTKQELEVGGLPCQRARHPVQEGVEFGKCFSALESLFRRDLVIRLRNEQSIKRHLLRDSHLRETMIEHGDA
jgi:hypothetical protein